MGLFLIPNPVRLNLYSCIVGYLHVLRRQHDGGVPVQSDQSMGAELEKAKRAPDKRRRRIKLLNERGRKNAVALDAWVVEHLKAEVWKMSSVSLGYIPERIPMPSKSTSALRP